MPKFPLASISSFSLANLSPLGLLGNILYRHLMLAGPMLEQGFLG
jgi:hypothetical protein